MTTIFQQSGSSIDPSLAPVIVAGIRVVTAALAGENIKYVTWVSTGSQQSAQHHVIFVACLEIMYCDLQPSCCATPAGGTCSCSPR